MLLRARNANRHRRRGDSQRNDQADHGKGLKDHTAAARESPVAAPAWREACRHMRLAGNFKVLHGVLQKSQRITTAITFAGNTGGGSFGLRRRD